jgi:hypothetical protein
MNARYIPPIAALASLAASAIVWLPPENATPQLPPLPQPLLPTAADFPVFDAGPSGIGMFDLPKRNPTTGPVAVVRGTERPTKDTPMYRLSAYIGGNGLWVVTLVDDSGKYCTVRTGEFIPHTRLEFRGMEFHPASNGIPEGTAVFYDQQSSNYVDVIACDGNGTPRGTQGNGSVQ